MPLNCPCCIDAADACLGCRHQSVGRCYDYFPSKPLDEILTPAERMTVLEAELHRVEAMAVLMEPPDQSVHDRITKVSEHLSEHIEMTTRAGKAKKPEPKATGFSLHD